jgi:hypothetical protein
MEPEGSLPRALYWSLSWARSSQFIPPRLISLWSILIVCTNLLLGLPSGLFPSGFPTNMLYAFLFYIRATCPPYLLLLDLNILIMLDEVYKLRSSSLCSFPLWNFVKSIFLRRGVDSLTPNPPAGGPALVGLPRLLFQYIRNYHPYMEAVSSVLSLKTRRVVVTRDPLNMMRDLIEQIKLRFSIFWSSCFYLGLLVAFRYRSRRTPYVGFYHFQVSYVIP